MLPLLRGVAGAVIPRELQANASTIASQPTGPLSPTDEAMLQYQLKMERDAMVKYRGLLLVLAVGYGIICMLSVALVVYLRRNRTVAFRGDSSAARKIILPAYIPLLVMLMAMAFVYSVYFWVLRAISTEVGQAARDLENEVYFSMRVFFILIVVIYMYQKSVTMPALKRATFLTFLLAFYNVPVVWLSTSYCKNPNVAYWIPNCSRLLVVVFLLWVLVMPPERASKRALREYVAFVLVYYVLFFAYTELFHRIKLDTGFGFAYANILWGSLCPLVIWRVLKADTEHWRGLGRRAVALQSLFRQKHRMNERISSRGLHVLIEMHRKYIIDFAYLELKRKIGTGSSAVVFNGVLHSKTPVAVKVYSPTELTDEVVAEFSHEAALCGALHHPNIVKFYGMCVCPPTICLVSELCQGSLDDVTKAIARRPHDVTRQQLMINLNYMIDATRAVAYLHSFSPAFIHRDIKPGNFLVDRNCVVKLTDFGESRSLPRECGPSRRNGTSGLSASAIQEQMEENDTSLLSRLSVDGWQGGESQHAASSYRPAMTVRGTAEYMAPEIIQGKAGTALYGEAADIFSLAMTLWDIVYPLEDKYPRANGNHLKVFETVLAGERPPFYGDFPLSLQELLSQAWDPRPEKRPSALAMLSGLEKIQQQVSCEVAAVLSNAMEKKIMISRKGCTTEHTSAGQDLIQKMLEFDIVDSLEEAVRAGNGLMSSGLLHHARHFLGFENSAEQFMFDERLMDSILHPQDRVFLPPIVERRHHSSSAAFSEHRTRGTSTGDGDDEASSTLDDVSEMEDEESVFGRSVGPGVEHGKAEEGRDAEIASVAAAIGSTVSELLRFGPRRKLSRGGCSTTSTTITEEDPRRMSTVHATSSQWANTTNADPNVCPCKRLGAGMMYVTRRGGGGGSSGNGASSSGVNKRFRRAKRATSNGSFLGDSTNGLAPSGSHFHAAASSSTGGLLSRATTSQSTTDHGLTAKLLMNEFSNTGGSGYSETGDVSPVQTPLSEVEMGFHVADVSDDEHEVDVLGVNASRQHFRPGSRTDQRADSQTSSTLEGSSSVESASGVHPVDLA